MDWSFLSTQKISQVYYQHLSNHCYFCRIKSNQLICPNCLNGFQLNQHHCEKCKLPSEEAIELCGRCQKKPPQYDHLISPFVYQGFSKTLITALKFSSHYHACHPLCHLLAQELNKFYAQPRTPWPDALIPVPSHTERIRERGFCHMSLLSHHLNTYLAINIPINTFTLIKSKHLAPQHALDKKQRNRLKANSFHCIQKPPSHIALFDDVVTTGSTLDACITTLKLAGAKKIDVWSLARTPSSNTKNN